MKRKSELEGQAYMEKYDPLMSNRIRNGEGEMKKGTKMKKARSEMMATARVYLIQAGGILGILFGVFLGTIGVNKAAGGTSTITIDWRPLFIVVVDRAVGLVFSIVGILALVGGIALSYVGFRLKRVNIACIILGSAGLIIPNMILGFGYNLVAGIIAIVIGFPWLVTLFLWLSGD
jgi:hypothetical protein